jgi:hypothetical protein
MKNEEKKVGGKKLKIEDIIHKKVLSYSLQCSNVRLESSRPQNFSPRNLNGLRSGG